MVEVFGNSNCCQAPILEPCDDGFGRCSNCGDMSTNECESCGAKLVNGKPKLDNSHAQNLRCIDWHIKQIMDNLRTLEKQKECPNNHNRVAEAHRYCSLCGFKRGDK